MNITTVNNTKVELMDSVFAVDYNEPLVHQVVVAYQAAAREKLNEKLWAHNGGPTRDQRRTNNRQTTRNI